MQMTAHTPVQRRGPGGCLLGAPRSVALLGPAREAFAAAVDACRDDAGLLDEPRLRRMATTIGVEPADFDEAADTAGRVRLFGSLAAGDTVSAAAMRRGRLRQTSGSY